MHKFPAVQKFADLLIPMSIMTLLLQQAANYELQLSEARLGESQRAEGQDQSVAEAEVDRLKVQLEMLGAYRVALRTLSPLGNRGPCIMRSWFPS